MFYSATKPTRIYRQNLPHWRQEGATYFVTFRLADSIPAERLNSWIQQRDVWLSAHPQPWDDATTAEYLQTFPAELERWLDAGHGSCVLTRDDCFDIVRNVIVRRQGTDYHLDEWTIMPNHVHAILTPIAGKDLSAVLRDWKAFSSNRINKVLRRTGALWQKDSFDHIVRDARKLEKFRKYIRNNGGRK